MGNRKLSVLVVDDVAYMRAMLREFISMLGHDVIEAANGVDAIAQFEKHQPNMVLIDMVMPDLDGLAATKIIRKLAGERWVPIIMISADDDQENLVRSLNQGCDDYVVKPVNLQILAAKIQAFQRVADMQAEMDRQREELRGYRDYAEEELSLTEHIMERLVRRGDHSNQRLQVWSDAVQGASGDIVLTALADNGAQYLMLADATGHGLAAAVTLIPITNVFYAMATKGFNVATIVEEMNQQVRSFCPTERFVAFTLVAVKPQADIIEVWNGGNPPVIVLDANGGIVRTFKSKHMPLGILNGDQFSAATEFLHYSDNLQLALFSDGLIEAGADEQYGTERLLAVLSVGSASTRLQRLQADFAKFLGSIKPHDDVSFTLLDCVREIPAAPMEAAESQLLCKTGARDWHLDALLSAEQLREVDWVPMLVDWGHKMGLSREGGGNFFVVMTELFVNALDHGLLALPSEIKQEDDGFERYFEMRQARLQQLNSGQIHIVVAQKTVEGQDVLTIRLRDSGSGFLHQHYQSTDLASNASRSGRGIALVQKLCRLVEYIGAGNEVYAELNV